MSTDNFVRINGGTFIMGSPKNEPKTGHLGKWENYKDKETQHKVTLRSFSISKYLVTEEEYVAVMAIAAWGPANSPSSNKNQNLPVAEVSWWDAIEYCNKRSHLEGLIPAYTIPEADDTESYKVTWNFNANGYRLPTEAEWEYACRAGTTTAYNTGNAIDENTGWYEANSSNDPHPIGQKSANAWGLYDMHGNVCEWCWDLYKIYPTGDQIDPLGASSGSYRVYRGGGYGNDEQGIRSARRFNDKPSFRSSFLGFRVVRL